MNELFASLFYVAMALSGLHSDAPPVVHLAEHNEMCEMNQQRSGCAAPPLGLFDPHYPQEVALLRELDLDSLFAQSFLVHEYVHYLQHQNGQLGTAPSCEEIVQLEVDALAAQQAFLKWQGSTLPGYGLQVMQYSAQCRHG